MTEKTSVLVTGGAGYVGSAVASNLVDYGFEVRVIDSMIFGKDHILEFFKKKSIDFIHGDIRDANIINRSLEGIDCVIHLAAITGPLCDLNPKATHQINEIATDKLIGFCKGKKVKRFLFASTCSNYGSNQEIVNEDTPVKSLSLYSETKIRSEELILQSRNTEFETCVLRLSTVFGLSPKMRFDLLVQELMKDAALNKKMLIFGPDYWRPLIHVSDISEACILAIDSPSDLISGETYNVGDTSQNFRKLELAKLIQEYFTEAEIVIQKQKKDPRNYRVSFEKIKRNLGFQIKKTVNDGIKEMASEIEKGNLNPKMSDFAVRSKLVKQVPVL